MAVSTWPNHGNRLLHEMVHRCPDGAAVKIFIETNANGSKLKHFESRALLQGKLLNDKGNLMRPSFSSKNGMRYRFCVSSALLRGPRMQSARRSHPGSHRRRATFDAHARNLAATFKTLG
jgi:hypothetical protein